MACKFDFDLNNKIIRCRIDGIVTDETLKEYYKLCSKYGALNLPLPVFLTCLP